MFILVWILTLTSCLYAQKNSVHFHPFSSALTVHPSLPCHVKDTRRALCPEGVVEALFTNIPHDVDIVPEIIGTTTHIVAQQSHTIPLEEKAYYEAYRGHMVMLHDKNVVFLGKNGKKGLFLDEKTLFYESMENVRFPKKISFSVDAVLSLFLHNKRKQECVCNLYYVQPLIKSRVHYRIRCEEKSFHFNAYLEVHNMSSFTYNNTDIFWSFPWNHHDKKNNILIAKNVSIQPLENKQCMLLSVTEPLKKIYCIPLESLKENMKYRADIRAHTTVSLKDFPDGPMAVYAKHNNNLHLVDMHNLKTHNDETLEFFLGQDKNIVATVDAPKKRHLGDSLVEKTLYIKVKNTYKKTVTLWLKLPKKSSWKITGFQEKPSTETETTALWSLTLAPESVGAFWYRIEEKQEQ